MSDVEELSSKIIESCKSLEQAENELVMLASNYDPNLDEKALEQLEKEEMEKLEYIHQQRKQLFTQFQEARRRGKISSRFP
jgi:ribosomal protein L7Ae-like RNA K-turn-binding protein